MSLGTLFLIFLLFTGLSALFNFLFLKWTKTLGTKNLAPSAEVRWSASYKPAIGGISFYIIFLVSYVVYLFINNPEFLGTEELTHLGILIVVTIGFFTGLADDAFNTVPWLKLSAQIVCGIVLLMFDVQIEFFEIYWLDALLTVFWTVAVMNSINMLDNMDGITTIVSIFILLAAAIGSGLIITSSLFYTFVCGGTVSALAGFLIFNWHPSKIFMGDTGSQMIGALLAAIGIIFFWNNQHIDINHTWYSKLSVVMTAFIIPIADSLTVTINRIKRGQSPFVGGKDHTTHHLSYAGLNDRQVALVMILISISSLTLITCLSFLNDDLKPFCYTVLLGYSISVIAFLYSTTLWKKSRSIFESKFHVKHH